MTEFHPNAVIEGPTRRYLVKGVRCQGDLTILYDGTYANGGGDNHVVIKVSRDTDDNDLVWNEAGILGAIYPPDQPEGKLDKYLPRLLDAFEAKDGHRVNVLARIQDYVSFEQILTAYPKGLNWLDVVWMYKRLLIGLGYAHTKGIIHGAIIPPHVMVHPVEHGAKLIDWSYALNFAARLAPKAVECCHGTPGCKGVGDKHWCVADPTAAKAPAASKPHKAANAWEKLLEDADYDPDPAVKLPKPPPVDPNRMYVRAMSVDWEHFYAPEILAKVQPTPATDLYMAAKCVVALLGGNVETNQMPDAVPVQVKAFLQSSLMPAMRARAFDAWELHDAFEKLVDTLTPRKYRPFTMPAKS
jgi:serine/threonine protein kinase